MKLEPQPDTFLFCDYLFKTPRDILAVRRFFKRGWEKQKMRGKKKKRWENALVTAGKVFHISTTARNLLGGGDIAIPCRAKH